MSLPKLRTWAALAALVVAVQAPAFAGEKADPSNQKRIELQLQGIDRQIDEEVFRLYDLTQGEVAEVEATVASLARAP